MTEFIQWPRKTRELHNHHFDSTIWNDLRFRDDDIITATYAKSGTTWMQQIIAQMLFGPDPDIAVADMSPWLDLRVPLKHEKLPLVEAQTHRRFLKTHLPVDALVFSPKAKYIYIGRDGRDIVPAVLLMTARMPLLRRIGLTAAVWCLLLLEFYLIFIAVMSAHW